MKHLSLAEIETMPTIRQGHADDLKLELGNTRIWVSRMTREDGMPYDNQITIEEYEQRSGAWKAVERYQAT